MSVIHVTKDNYDEVVVQSEKKVLLDFWAPWCGPCKMVGPIIEEIAAERQDIVVCKVDVDTEMELARKFRVVSIPTLVVMEGGEVKTKSVGYQPKEDILAML